jgi:hypothetical protein
VRLRDTHLVVPCPNRWTRRRYLHDLALGPRLLLDLCVGPEMDYVGRNSQRKLGR